MGEGLHDSVTTCHGQRKDGRSCSVSVYGRSGWAFNNGFEWEGNHVANLHCHHHEDKAYSGRARIREDKGYHSSEGYEGPHADWVFPFRGKYTLRRLSGAELCEASDFDLMGGYQEWLRSKAEGRTDWEILKEWLDVDRPYPDNEEGVSWGYLNEKDEWNILVYPHHPHQIYEVARERVVFVNHSKRSLGLLKDYLLAHQTIQKQNEKRALAG